MNSDRYRSRMNQIAQREWIGGVLPLDYGRRVFLCAKRTVRGCQRALRHVVRLLHGESRVELRTRLDAPVYKSCETLSLSQRASFMASLLKHSYARISLTTKCTTKKMGFVRKASTTVSESPKDAITWPEYLEIRRRKRRWETVCRSHFCLVLRSLNLLSPGNEHPFLPSRPRGWSRILWFSRDRRDQTDHGEPSNFTEHVKSESDRSWSRELTP